FTFDNFLKTNAPAAFGENGYAERIPLAQHGARQYLLAILDAENCAIGKRKLFEFLPLRTQDQELTVAGQGDTFARFVGQDGDALQLDGAGTLGLELGVLHFAIADAADVEGAHGELRA